MIPYVPIVGYLWIIFEITPPISWPRYLKITDRQTDRQRYSEQYAELTETTLMSAGLWWHSEVGTIDPLDIDLQQPWHLSCAGNELSRTCTKTYSISEASTNRVQNATQTSTFPGTPTYTTVRSVTIIVLANTVCRVFFLMSFCSWTTSNGHIPATHYPIHMYVCTQTILCRRWRFETYFIREGH